MFRAKGSKLLKYPRVEQTETWDERLWNIYSSAAFTLFLFFSLLLSSLFLFYVHKDFLSTFLLFSDVDVFVPDSSDVFDQ